jgi:hypothetical protein
MIRIATLIVAVGLAVPVSGLAPDTLDGNSVTWTGWFSDKDCAAPRVARGVIGPNNPDCVKRCLNEGATPVFVSEQAKALFEVRDYPSVKDDVGYHVELTGTVDDKAKTISVHAVKRLKYVGALCAVPKKQGERTAHVPHRGRRGQYRTAVKAASVELR